MANLSSTDVTRLRELALLLSGRKMEIDVDRITLTDWFGWREVTVDQTSITIKQGRKVMQEYLPNDIEQLFVQQIDDSPRRNKRKHHFLSMQLKSGTLKSLFTDLSVYQALYLEQAFERLLGIQDCRTVGEFRHDWRQFADEQGLNFGIQHSMFRLYMEGTYRGRPIIFGLSHYGLFKLILQHNSKGVAPKAQEVDPLDIDTLKKHFVRGQYETVLKGTPISGHMYFSSVDQTLIYNQSRGGEPSLPVIKHVLDKLSDFLDLYPQIVALGSEAILALSEMYELQASKPTGFWSRLFSGQKQRQPKGQVSHPYVRLPSYVTQLVEDAAQENRTLESEMTTMMCTTCLTRCSDFAVDLFDKTSIPFCGCRTCRKSITLDEAKPAIAVLDNQMTDDFLNDEGKLRINWLARMQPFDLDQVEIVSATDHQIERFVMMLGNDTDPFRRPYYQTKPCFIAADCPVSPNALKLLEKTFAQVVIGDAV